MKVTTTSLPELLILEPKVYGDEREFFFESFHEKGFTEQTGQSVSFVQGKHYRSHRLAYSSEKRALELKRCLVYG